MYHSRVLTIKLDSLVLDSASFGRQWHVHGVDQNLAMSKIGSHHHVPSTSSPMAEWETCWRFPAFYHLSA